MLASGNGKAEVCANNLIKTTRFQVPYDRIKGIDGSLIDKPNRKLKIAADAQWLIETYEKRAKVNSVTVKTDGTDSGVTADITVNFRED